MKTLTAIALIVMSLTSGVLAQEASAPFVSYTDALAKCSAEWKASETRKATPKGKGVEAWNTFRRACVVEKGYVKGRKAPQG